MIRVMFIALAAVCVALASQAMAQFNVGPGPLGPSDPARTTTVKSSKSNTSDRMGGGGGKGSASARWVTSLDIRTQTECGKIKGVWSAKSKTCKVKTN